MREFDFIATLMQPLTDGDAGALGLRDDAALLAVPEGMELVITKDVMQQGIHFFGHEPARLTAQKLLRTNLSDLAAMGAKPVGYLLGLGLPRHVGENWLTDFAAGLHADNLRYGVHVLGGDTTRTRADVSLSLTAFGQVPRGQAVTRCGAQVGDKLYVTGTLGDSALGLRVMRGEDCGLSDAAKAYAMDAYLLPKPQVELGLALRGVATSMMDISDGLVQDAGHIARASGVQLRIKRAMIPLSNATQMALHLEGEMMWRAVLAGGDDYQLLFTAPAAAAVPSACMCIGDVVAGDGVVVLDEAGCVLAVAEGGYQHF